VLLSRKQNIQLVSLHVQKLQNRQDFEHVLSKAIGFCVLELHTVNDNFTRMLARQMILWLYTQFFIIKYTLILHISTREHHCTIPVKNTLILTNTRGHSTQNYNFVATVDILSTQSLVLYECSYDFNNNLRVFLVYKLRNRDSFWQWQIQQIYKIYSTIYKAKLVTKVLRAIQWQCGYIIRPSTKLISLFVHNITRFPWIFSKNIQHYFSLRY